MNSSSSTWVKLTAGAGALALSFSLAACGGETASDKPEKKAAAKGDGTLTVGQLLPQTGSLAFLGPPEFAGVNLAIKEINEAGGVLGKDVKAVPGDEGDSNSGIAPAEADKLIAAKSDVIIGTASSGVAQTVVDKVMSSGTVLFSGANTSTSFDEGKYSKPDLYFRTSPSDILQGAVMSNLLLEDKRTNVAILARQDAYGETLAEQVKTNLEGAGSKVATTSFYSQDATSFDAQVNEVAGSGADAVVVIGFEETKKLIPQLIAAGAGPSKLPTYFVDGNLADYTKEFGKGEVKGVKGTLPGAESSGDFKAKLKEVDPKLKDHAYSAECYDATVISALAAIAAKNDSGEAIAEKVVDVTTGGKKVKTFAEGVKALEAGEDIDYDGVSGPIELGETGSPTAASIGIYQYDDKGAYAPVKYIAGQI
ncbi:amino acid/amide ABC transporter substrate-binding protein (HAAT family) [Nocardioides albertanoniae]|uniref:Amino acid/amide ABC transporter substrate-binding protein (HAAT family) n=1 Tax=Nocardioides albertanoniae TaxID=1175486 RepID=A0A543A990_9ACTN|nr:amino acid/amide ABC transporter substrate-binding protein (HAAT family) [Nocardioides albertanoniae]